MQPKVIYGKLGALPILQRLGGVQEYLIDGASENEFHLFAATKMCYANQLWDNAYIQQDIGFIFLIKGSMINGLFTRELVDKFHRTERTERLALEPSSNCEAYFPTDSLSAPLSMGSGKYADFVQSGFLG